MEKKDIKKWLSVGVLGYAALVLLLIFIMLMVNSEYLQLDSYIAPWIFQLLFTLAGMGFVGYSLYLIVKKGVEQYDVLNLRTITTILLIQLTNVCWYINELGSYCAGVVIATLVFELFTVIAVAVSMVSPRLKLTDNVKMIIDLAAIGLGLLAFILNIASVSKYNIGGMDITVSVFAMLLPLFVGGAYAYNKLAK